MLQSLDRRCLGRQRLVLDLVPEPARIIALAEMVRPRLIVNALGQLDEQHQVLGPQVQLALGAVEVETALGRQLPRRVLARMAAALDLARGNPYALGCLAFAAQPQ